MKVLLVDLRIIHEEVRSETGTFKQVFDQSSFIGLLKTQHI
jgi:hypothetical protein